MQIEFLVQCCGSKFQKMKNFLEMRTRQILRTVIIMQDFQE